MSYLRSAEGGLLLSVRVQPRAAKNEVAGGHGESLKIRLTSPPVDGKANKALIAFLSKLFKLPKSAFSIQSGERSREKQIFISGLDEEPARQILADAQRD